MSRRLASALTAAALALAALEPGMAGAAAASADPAAAGITLLPKAVRAAAERIAPSLVRIDAYGADFVAQPARGRGAPRDETAEYVRSSEGPATGLVLDAEGHIVTSTFSLARRLPVLTVTLADGSQRVAQILGQDQVRRLCLLKIDNPPALTVPAFAPQGEARVGQWVIAAGYGHGGPRPNLSLGVLSARERFHGRVVQTDANIGPANYGGPLMDIEGRVIGICVPMSGESEEIASGVEWYDSGIGFAAPLDPGSELVRRMKTGEELVPGKLGIAAQDLPDASGVVVTRVDPKSAAESAGVRVGDVILAIAGESVRGRESMKVLVRNLPAGAPAELRIRRKDEVMTVRVVPAAK